MHDVHNRYNKILPATIIFSSVIIVIGFILAGFDGVIHGLYTMITMQDILLTDYVQIAGLGAALVNAGLVTVISILVLHFARDPYNGYTLMDLGLQMGFAFFGKNIANILPIILGSWIYSKHRREPFSKFASAGLLSTCLAPVVSYMAFGSRFAHPLLGILIGLLIGFVMPSISAYTYRIQNGMNLHNVGFAASFLALMIVPILSALGDEPKTVLYWAEGYNIHLALILGIFCVACIVTGFFFCGDPPWAAWAGYRRLLSKTGRAPSDYLRMFGFAPTLINMGINGLIGMLYLYIIDGDLNGPTVGAILTIIGFSAAGKHARNIIPLMLGVALGGLCIHGTVNNPTLQIAGLFVSGLAPISGHFGWPFGILAGILHSCLVLEVGTPVAGMNLSNNAYSGGIIAIVLYPAITAIFKRHRPLIKDDSFFHLFDDDTPIDVSEWRTHRREKKLQMEQEAAIAAENIQAENEY